MRNFILIAIAENIEPQTVAFSIDGLLQFMFEQLVLAVIDHAFKDGILHSCSVSNALLGNLS